MSGEVVLSQVTRAFAVSVTLMLGALVVTIAVAALVSARTLYLGSRRRLHRGSDAIGVAVLAALPSLALGVPSGAMIGGLLDQTLPAAFNEPWARTWHVYGFAPHHVARHALRRPLAGVLPQLLPTVVGLVGGAVAVEKIFNIPGLGRLALDSAVAQDLPPLQTATLTLILPALHTPALPRGRFIRLAAGAYALALLMLVLARLLCDHLHVDTAARLLPLSR
ncbi:ABC transporter permease subunit [Streptomyces griseiscabiei]|uniref:ABC transporter permease subunit n=1 Tax=Streptomyces griseiscabiei TaxID=2993540 RepID=UPI0029E7DC6F|nr:ABC transporter permease subunit [Streptomyces griseiscabiei]